MYEYTVSQLSLSNMESCCSYTDLLNGCVIQLPQVIASYYSFLFYTAAIASININFDAALTLINNIFVATSYKMVAS